MATQQELVSFLDDLLQCQHFSDACPNGLQVEGRSDIRKIVSGVTASQALIAAAIEQQADAILVHHGYFWRGEDLRVTGMKRQRLASLLQHDINLLAYHLPLDCHGQFGNNIQLAKQLGIPVDTAAKAGVFPGDVPPLVRSGTLEREWQGADYALHVGKCLGRIPLHIPANRPIRRIAWCTGAAQSEIETAIALGVDAYLTGEASEQTVHIARENNLHFFAAGHHATERYGVQALGEELSRQFTLEHRFIDCDNPV